MATGVKISNLPPIAAPAVTDVFPVSQSGVTYKETAQQLINLFHVSGGLVLWSNIAGTTQAAAVNSGYVIGNAGITTVTLPVTAALGSIVAVQGQGAAGWILAAGVGQTIKYGQQTTSSGGSLTSAHQYDSIEVVCLVANTTWGVRFSLSTGLTIA